MVGPTSILIGQTAKRMTLHERFNINLLAVSRSGQHFTERLRDIILHPGDVLVLKGDLDPPARQAAGARLSAAGRTGDPPGQCAPGSHSDSSPGRGHGAYGFGRAARCHRLLYGCGADDPVAERSPCGRRTGPSIGRSW